MLRGIMLAVVVAFVAIGCRQVLGVEEAEPVELGANCTGPNDAGDVALCPSAVPVCLSLDRAAFCTAPCGNTPPGVTQPPPGADAICEQFASPGTPRCAVGFAPDPGSATSWFCAIMCGVFEGTDLGTCPIGLRCVDFFCR